MRITTSWKSWAAPTFVSLPQSLPNFLFEVHGWIQQISMILVTWCGCDLRFDRKEGLFNTGLISEYVRGAQKVFNICCILAERPINTVNMATENDLGVIMLWKIWAALAFESLPQYLPNFLGKVLGQINQTSSILAYVGHIVWLPSWIWQKRHFGPSWAQWKLAISEYIGEVEQVFNICF